MSELINERCTACRPDAPRVTGADVDELKPQIPDWSMLEREGIDRLERTYSFGRYPDSVAFAMKVALLAEAEGHHPSILIDFKRVTVTWWTHKIGGLHRNDFIAAAKTDALYA